LFEAKLKKTKKGRKTTSGGPMKKGKAAVIWEKKNRKRLSHDKKERIFKEV